MEYAHKLSKLVIGHKYLVAHARIWVSHYGEVLEVPVFPHFHQDASFSNAPAHYHIDKRFAINGKERFLLKRKDYLLNDILISSATERIEEIVFKEKKCLRLDNTLYVPETWHGDRFRVWYQSMIGKSCAGKRCPHYGSTMIETNGKIYCPLHNLHADPITLKVVNPY